MTEAMRNEVAETTVAQLDCAIASMLECQRWAERLRDNILSGEHDTQVVLQRSRNVLRTMGDICGLQSQLAYHLARLSS